MATSTRFFDLVRHLQTTFAALPALTADGVEVVVGPVARGRDNGRGLLLVMATLEDDDVEFAGSWSQQWAYLGRSSAPKRNEDAQVVCQLVVLLGGSTDFASALTRAETYWDALAEAVRADRDSWSAGGAVTHLHITSTTARAAQTELGAAVVLTFTVESRSTL